MRKLFNIQRCYFYSVSNVEGGGVVKECSGNWEVQENNLNMLGNNNLFIHSKGSHKERSELRKGLIGAQGICICRSTSV